MKVRVESGVISEALFLTSQHQLAHLGSHIRRLLQALQQLLLTLRQRESQSSSLPWLLRQWPQQIQSVQLP